LQAKAEAEKAIQDRDTLATQFDEQSRTNKVLQGKKKIIISLLDLSVVIYLVSMNHAVFWNLLCIVYYCKSVLIIVQL